MRIFATLLLCAAGLLTLWTVRADTDVPGHYTRWGELNMTAVWSLVALRWLLFTVAFSVLLATHQLSSWLKSGFFLGVLVIGGLLLFEFLSGGLLYNAVSERLPGSYHLPYYILSVLLPACVIAGGLLPSRGLFLLGIAGVIVATAVGSSREKSYVIERDARIAAATVDIAEKGGVKGLLTSTNLLYGQERVQAVVDRIERQPDWINETAKELDDSFNRAMALYVLCRDPARLKLSEELQERCWAAARILRQALQKDLDATKSAQGADAASLRAAMVGLAGFPSPVRERHRDEFDAAREFIKQYSATLGNTVDVPGESAWVAAGGDAGPAGGAAPAK